MYSKCLINGSYRLCLGRQPGCRVTCTPPPSTHLLVPIGVPSICHSSWELLEFLVLMSPMKTNFGYSSIHPCYHWIMGREREREETHWEGEEKTNVFCILLPWLALTYAWNRRSVNTWGMYVQMNEKKNCWWADIWEGKDMRVMANFSWLCLHNIYRRGLPSPWIVPKPNFLLTFAQVICNTHQAPLGYPNRSLGVDQAPHFGFRALESLSCGQKTFYCWS